MTDTDTSSTTPDRDPTASGLVAACEAAWADIQTHHPELPPVVIVLGSGVQGGKLVKLGHWWQSQWLADGAARGEVLIAGEALHLPAEQVFEVLLHEAAHGVNCARGIKDTSRGGRYHNQLFKATALEVGLRVQQMPPYGWASTSLTPKAIDTYRHAIDGIAEHQRIARTLPRSIRTGIESGAGSNGPGSGPGGGSPGGDADRQRRSSMAACGCGRNLRIAPGVLAKGPVVCGLCGTDFAPKQPQQRIAPTAAATPAGDFVERRNQAIAGETAPPDPMQEGLAFLDALERAVHAVADRTGDRTALEVVRRERAGNVAWLDELTNADVVDLADRRRRGEPRSDAETDEAIDLRTVPLGREPVVERPAVEIEGPGR